MIDGGAEEDRTPDLRIANATLSQLSYGPTQNKPSTPEAASLACSSNFAKAPQRESASDAKTHP